MKRALRMLGLACACVAAIGHGTPALATCDVPLAITQSGGDANVLIILDNSMSMNEAMVSDAYVASTAWSGSFNGGSTYNISATGDYTPSSFNSRWASTPSARLVTSEAGASAQYDGNYLNWVFFHATAAQRAAIPTVTRILAAKQAVSTVLATNSNCRFGLMVYNGDAGGRLLSAIGSSVASIQAQVTALRADAFTPLGETLVSALDYYATRDVNAPIQASCQKSFVVIVSDGLPTHDLNVPAYLRDYDGDGQDPGNCTTLNTGYPNSMDCSGYLDDVACYMYRNDLRPDLDDIQNVPVFVIGVNIDAPLLQSAADEGGGEYFTVSNSAGLAAALSETFNNIQARISAGAAVSVVSAEDRQNNRLYRARYESQTWKGFVEAFNLPYHSGDHALWEAGSLLASRDPATRTILTSSSGSNTTAFTSANAATLQSPMAAVDVTEATNIINYVRGAAVTGTRDRGGWKLGDVVDAAPLMVGKPGGFTNLPGYWAYRAAHANRTEVLYVAANDGMLHCFDATSGDETWAYVPKNQLPRLKDLMSTSYCHEYFVNLTPTVYDMSIGGTWKTVLVGGQERGGSGLFALDVTDPAANQVSVLWDVDLPALKGSWNPPTLLRDRTQNGHVLAVGTGYDGTVAQTSLLEISPADGSVLATYALGSPVAANKVTKATPIDTNLDGYDDLLYMGDLAGNVWRVNLATNPWTVSRLFNCGKPIQAAPVVSMDSQGRPLVFFGTGQYLTSADPSTTTTQTIYALVDDGSGTAITSSDVVDQSSTLHAVGGATRGWYVNLTQHAGERVTRSPLLIAGTLYVTSFRPNAGACAGGGQSWLYSLDYEDGSAPDHNNGTDNNTTAGRVESMGDGILADPSVDLVNEAIVLQSSNAVLITHGVNTGIRKLMVRSWRQKWN